MISLLALLAWAGCYTPPEKHSEVRVIEGKTYDCMCSEETTSSPVCNDNYCNYQETYECKCLKRTETNASSSAPENSYNGFHRWR